MIFVDTVFVRDILRAGYLAKPREYFYSFKEKTISLLFLGLFTGFISFYFLGSFVVFFKTDRFILSIIIFVFAIFITARYWNFSHLKFCLFPFMFMVLQYIFFFLFFNYLVVLDESAFYKFFRFLYGHSLKTQVFLDRFNVARPLVHSFLANFFKLIFCFFFIVLNWKQIKCRIKELKYNVLSVLFFLLFLVLLNFFFNRMFFFDNILQTNETLLNQIYWKSSLFNKIFFIILVVLVIPVYEETLFRYSVFTLFGRKRAVVGLVFAIVWFTVAHYRSTDFVDSKFFFDKVFSSKLFFYLYASFLLSYFYWFYQLNLFFPIFCHIFFNFSVSATKIQNLLQ